MVFTFFDVIDFCEVKGSGAYENSSALAARSQRKNDAFAQRGFQENPGV
jgi:hypothetical protein